MIGLNMDRAGLFGKRDAISRPRVLNAGDRAAYLRLVVMSYALLFCLGCNSKALVCVTSGHHPQAADVPEKGRIVLDLGEGTRMSFVWVGALNLWAGEFEVTNAQFRRFRRTHDSKSVLGKSLNGDEQPVVMLVYEDAEAFVGWLNEEVISNQYAGIEAKLPDGKEWETLARCGDSRKYPWGDEWPPSYGNYGALVMAGRAERAYSDRFDVTCPVKESGKNDWGVYGLAGNVWEFTTDFHDVYTNARVLRGGAWPNKVWTDSHGNDRWMLCSYRYVDATPYVAAGFRVLIIPVGAQN